MYSAWPPEICGAGPDLFQTEHRPAAQAPFAAAAGGLNPRHADAVADATRADTHPDTDDLADRLMTKRARKRPRELASRLVHVGVTEATCVYLDQHLSRPRLRGRHFLDFPPRIGGRNDCGSHQSISLSGLNGGPPSLTSIREHVPTGRLLDPPLTSRPLRLRARPRTAAAVARDAARGRDTRRRCCRRSDAGRRSSSTP